MSQEQFERTKPYLNVGTIGHIDHGKTTLTAALSTVLAKHFGGDAVSLQPINNPSEGREGDMSSNTPRVQYSTHSRHYFHLDYPQPLDYVKNMMGSGAQMDGAILVVSATTGPMSQTREHILLARQAGIPHITVFLNKCDIVDDEDVLELIEMEVRELLCEYDFPGDNLPVVRGSALGALNGETQWEEKILELANLLDTDIPEPERATDLPFLVSVEDVFSIPGRGIFVSGSVERGIIRTGDEVEIVGLRSTVKTTCSAVEVFGEPADEGRAGENINVLLRGVKREDIDRGQVLAKPRSIRPHTKFEAAAYILSKAEGGRHLPFFKGHRPQFYFRNADVTGVIDLFMGLEMVMPGDHVQMIVNLIAPIAMDEGLRFSIREGSRTIGFGVVTKVAV